MEPKFEVQCKIQRPVAEVFDAVYNPSKLTEYFTTESASGPLEEGSSVMWKFADCPGDVPVTVKQMVLNELIVLEWAAAKRDYNTRVEMRFQSLDDSSTMVKIFEAGWQDNDQDIQSSFRNCHGWTQMSACLKAYLEYDINLRKGYY